MSSTELKPIILYDLPCTIPGRPWSPNTMKARYCLGYKRLPFTTVWVELPDIEGFLQSKGITQPPYTLPVIEDPNTGALVVDSLAIATYLDEKYPETPKVLSPTARALLQGVEEEFSFASGASGPGSDPAPRLVFIILSANRLNPVSKVYYHRTRAARLNGQWTTLHDACSAGLEDRAERVRQGIDAIRGVWRKVTALYDHQSDSDGGRSGGPFVLGEEPCFLDFVVAGRVKFLIDLLLPSEVETVRNLEGGKLARLVESLERYYIY
ncbi:hypothetical protein OG21DRAFT_304527 [Imleria badia]|nr:hypothetical protein OG21DRAFT_304527 [Imleria badia]